MKLVKNFIFIFTLLVALFLVGCKTPEEPKISVEQLKTDVRGVFDTYNNSEHGSFKIVAVDGDETKTIEMIYNYGLGKTSVSSLKQLYTDKNGTISCYITDGKAYFDRYDTGKTVQDVSSADSKQFASKYSFSSFAYKLDLMLSESFFDAVTVDSDKNNVVKATLGIGIYDILSEEQSDDLTAIFDGIKEKTEVTLEVTYTDTVVTNIKVVLVGEVTSSIELQLFGSSDSNMKIDFPDFSDYQ